MLIIAQVLNPEEAVILVKADSLAKQTEADNAASEATITEGEKSA
jgi:hypothetical protein